jgi:hypothetical protein
VNLVGHCEERSDEAIQNARKAGSLRVTLCVQSTTLAMTIQNRLRGTPPWDAAQRVDCLTRGQ